MSAPPAAGRPMSPEKLERELLARLGLDPSATPEDLAAAHEAVTTYLAAAPKGLRAWARTQAAGADEAYALLTDPAALSRAVALVGAGARPAVLPGGPATPPAHRDSSARAAAAAVPAAAAAALPAPSREAPRVDENGRRIVSDDEIDALLAEVDPNARPEIVGTASERAASRAAAAPTPAPAGGGVLGFLGSNAFRNLALVGATVVGIVLVAAIGFGGQGASGIGAAASPSPVASAPALDQAAVAALMQKIQADPQDADSLMALGDEYYRIGDFSTAAGWFAKATDARPEDVRGFLALGAATFNQGDSAGAEAAWKQAVALDDTSVEAHYYLGYLYFSRENPDMAAVQREWGRVVALDPDGDLARTVTAHLDALASLSPGPSGSPAASPAGSPPASPAPSAAPSVDPSAAPSTAPSASPPGTPVP